MRNITKSILKTIDGDYPHSKKKIAKNIQFKKKSLRLDDSILTDGNTDFDTVQVEISYLNPFQMKLFN